MVNFTIAVAEEDVNSVILALSEGYQSTIIVDGVEVANPMTQAEFANLTCRNWIAKKVGKYLQRQAANAVNVDVVLTDPATGV